MTETLDDELERLLDTCQAKISGIELYVSELEAAGRPASRPRPEPLPRPERRPAPPPQAAPPPEPSPDPARPAAPPEDRAPGVAPLEPPARPWEPPFELREPAPQRPLPAPAARGEQGPFSRLTPSALDDARGPALAFLLAGAAAVAAGLLLWRAPRLRPDRVIELDSAQALVVRPERGDLLIAQGLKLVELSADGRARDWQALDAPLTGIAWSQDGLWSVDASTAAVERRSNGKSVVFPLNHIPTAVYARDRYLWTLEKGGEMIHQFMLSTTILGPRLLPLDLYRLPGLSTESIALDDGGLLWLVDKRTGRLFRLRLEGISYRAIDSAPLTPLIGASSEVLSLSVEGGAVWLLVRPEASARSVLHRIPAKLLYWTPA